VKAILFDFGGTLIDSSIFKKSSRKMIYETMDSLYGLANSFQHIEKLYNEISGSVWSEHQDTDPRKKEKVVRYEILSRLIHTIGKTPNPTDLNRLFSALVAGAIESDCLYPKTRSVMEHLHMKYKMAIVSNGLAEYTWPTLEINDIADFFCVKVISEEVGFEKPDQRIFQIALDKLEVEPYEVVMVGNMLYEDIFGAYNAGIRSIWINRNEPQRVSDVVPDFELKDIGDIINIV
jgi:HAD superfamily hydrolase (TIGR01509 family)